MKINHVALYVKNLEGARDFFITYFDGVSNEKYRNDKTGFESYFISFSGGTCLELMTKPGLIDCGERQDRYGYAHIAFSLGSRERVNKLTKKLIENGYTLVSGPRITGDGYYESCMLGFEGNAIEITV